jgi:peptide/nickel transport system ATP-binding protein
MAPLLSIRNLRTEFTTDDGTFAAIDDVSFDLGEGGVLGIVGESGSGKSVTALSIMRLIASPAGRIANGEVWFAGRNLLGLSERRMREIRGGAISMIFQEPMSSLNPVFTVGDQITETVRRHERLGSRAAREKALEMLNRVGIPSPAQRLDEYPHQLSGGMRQRVMIAIALSCNPRLLLADEPTTALDVTIQAQILELLRELQEEFGMAVILITHDLGVVAEFVDRVIVMYAGRTVESAAVHPTFEAPRHPYTEGLLGSIPSLDDERERLQVIEGVVPSPFALPPGCRYAPRCRYARPECDAMDPPLLTLGPDHRAACIRHTGYQVP